MLTPAAPPDGRLLIYAPVPLHRVDGVLTLDDQACRGLALWARNFAHVTALMPVIDGQGPPNWGPLDRIGPDRDRIRLVPLPGAWRPDRFLRALPAARRIIGEEINKADYLSFAIGGLFGDWGAVASFTAHRRGRRFAVWTDRVESDVTRRGAQDAATWRERLRARLTHRPMAALERAVIRRATLGLFHGRDTFDTYAPYSRNPQIVHDVLVGAEVKIDAAGLAAKQAQAAGGALQILYAGRAEAMKGPLDWVAVLVALRDRGVDFRATWVGEGSLWPAMQQAVAAAGLQTLVSLPGFERDRGRMMDLLRRAHVLMFCHKTAESPRVLIEALMHGTPIVGYDGAYPADLIAAQHGGLLTPRDDVEALVEAVAGLAADRGRLADLIGRAAADGSAFDDVSVFAHRSAVIRQYLGR